MYFSRRTLPAKYLVPGLLFLLVYQLFVMAYTGYVAFTNYGDGHNSTKADAIEAILVQNERRVEGSPAYPLTVVTKDGDLGFAIVQDGEAQVGTADEPLEPADDATIEGGKVTAVPGYGRPRRSREIAQQQEAIIALRVPVSDDPNDGSLRTQDGSTGYVYESTLDYDEAADTMTDTDDRDGVHAGRPRQLRRRGRHGPAPGWRVTVGFENFTTAFTDSRHRADRSSRSSSGTSSFAILSVVTTLRSSGSFLAVVFNDPRIKGRRIYRSLLILPVRVPGVHLGLVWRGMLNERLRVRERGAARRAPTSRGSPTRGWRRSRSSLVNLWLGFPYMFLVCTGALQSIPGDVIESARMDGARAWRIQRSIVLPLLLVSVAPLLIASFAFNFNNFTLIYMLTGGGPNFPGTPILVGHTDILISMVYSVAFESGLKQYGLASALSIIIFLIVGAISWWGFRRTRRLEEL